MKKVLYFIFSALLLLAMAAAVSSCSSDEEEKRLDIFTPETKISEEIKSFFEAELPPMSISTGFFTSENYDTEICYAINDDSTLRSFYTGSRTFPSIDFSRYTLVIGKVRMETSFYYVKEQNISITEKFAIVNLRVSPLSKESNWPAFSTLYFWGLYPKFFVENITFNKIRDL